MIKTFGQGRKGSRFLKKHFGKVWPVERGDAEARRLGGLGGVGQEAAGLPGARGQSPHPAELNWGRPLRERGAGDSSLAN